MGRPRPYPWSAYRPGGSPHTPVINVNIKYTINVDIKVTIHYNTCMAKFAHLEDLHQDFEDPESMPVDDDAPYNWRKAIETPLESGDVTGIKEAALPSAQLQMLHLAHNAKSETVRFQATAYLLAQSGHGPMNKVEHTVDYKKLPTEQLQAVIQAKLGVIMKYNPEFKVDTLIPQLESGEETLHNTDVSRETAQIIEGEVCTEEDHES